MICKITMLFIDPGDHTCEKVLGSPVFVGCFPHASTISLHAGRGVLHSLKSAFLPMQMP